mmetsp:Transcript_63683/g.151859  ORF Transcript_63683/g.151859 Transcript_63683/m.151859 type:complete len:83 (-) Transcript_63683:44-292(-)
MSQGQGGGTERCLECEAAARLAAQQAADPSSKQSKLLAQSSCKEEYAAVSACMQLHEGQVRECSAEWEVFKQCHGAATKPRT